MAKFEVWLEGFIISGNSESARYCGTFEAETFKDACSKSITDEKSRELYDEKGNTFWGCRFFQSEEESRKAFG